MRKTITQFFALLTFILLTSFSMNAQTGTTLLDTDFEDWKLTEAFPGGIVTEQANGTFDLPGATVKIQGRPTFNNATSTPQAGTSEKYPNYFRFGSDGSATNQYLEITPNQAFVNGGRITVIVSTNANPADADIFYIADAGSWDEPLAKFNQIGKEFTVKTFDLPETYTGTKTIRLYRLGTTVFLHAIKIETNGGTPSIDSFKIGELEATIDQEAGTITAELPQGSSLTAITPVVTLGGSAKSYTPTGAQDFTNPVTYTAFNADKSLEASYTVTLTVAVTLSDDATLKSLKYKGASVTGFASDVYTYTMELPYGTAVPAVEDITAESNHVNATVATPVRSSATFPTDISVKVTAENGLADQTYVIHFTQKAASTDASLKTLKANGNTITLEANVYDYTIDVPHTTIEVPAVEATANDAKATVVITDASNLQGKTKVDVTAEDGTTKKQYTVAFNVLPAPQDPVTTWNFSEFPFGDIESTFNGLNIVDNRPDGSAVTIDANKKSIDGFDFTQRLKLGGSGNPAETAPFVPVQRYVSFDVKGKSSIVIYGMSSSSSADRPVMITDGKQLLDEPVLLGTSITKVSYEYTGAATTIYLYSKKDGINLYAIQASNVGTGTGISTVLENKEVKSVRYYDVLGRPATASTQGIVIVKTTYTDGTSSSNKVYRLEK